MRLLNFPYDAYDFDGTNNVYSYRRGEEPYTMGCLELLWFSLIGSPLELNKKMHKTNKRLKSKVRELTIYKDPSKEARVGSPLNAEPKLILEEDEYELLNQHLDVIKFNSRVSEDVDRLYEVIESASPFKPTLVKE